MQKKLYLFIFILILTPFLVDSFFFQMYGDQESHIRISKQIRKKPPSILAIGSSRMAAGIRPDAFQRSVFTIFFPFADIHILSILVKGFENELLQVDHLILEWSPEIFFLETMHWQPEARQMFSEMDIPFHQRKWKVSELFPLKLGVFFPSLAKYRWTPSGLLARWIHGARKSASPAEIQILEERGYAPRLSYEDKINLNADAELKIRELKKRFSDEALERGKIAFDQLIAFLTHRKINFCFLELPVSSEYLDQFRNILGDGFRTRFRSLNTHTCGGMKPQSQEFKYHDSDHLYFDSALQFSSQLNL